MHDDAVVVSRRRLYEEIWETPAYEVAKRYGISNSALTSACQKLNIPRPSKRYWARQKAGHQVERVALPPLRDGQSEEHRIARRISLDRAPETSTEDNSVIAVSSSLVVPSVLEKPHRFVALALKTALKARPDRDGLVHPDGLPIAVSPAQVERASRFLDTMLKSVERAGHKALQSENRQPGKFVIDGVEIEFSIKERLTRVPHVTVKGELFSPRWDYKPSGDLRFKLEWDRGWGMEKLWEDRTRRRLENAIAEIFDELLRIPERHRAVQAERRARADRERQEQERRWQEEAKGAEQQRKSELLVAQARRWKDSLLVREFAAAVREYAEHQFGGIAPESSAAQWLSFAQSVADRLDPRPEMFGVATGPKTK